MDRLVAKPDLIPMTPQPTSLSPEGELKRPIKCLLCDIYGTLLISGSGDIGISCQQDLREASLQKLLRKYKIERRATDLRQDLFAAIKKYHCSKIAEGIDHPEVNIDQIWASILPFDDLEDARTFAAQWEFVVNPVWPMPGLTEMIQSCRRSGIVLGIVSNAQFFTPLLFDWLLGTDLEGLGFDRRLTFFSYQHGRSKPSLFLFESAAESLETLGIPRDQTAFIGNDIRNDIIPAQQAGFQTILFAGDARSLRLREGDPDCLGYTPNLQITHLSQLAPLMLSE